MVTPPLTDRMQILANGPGNQENAAAFAMRFVDQQIGAIQPQTFTGFPGSQAMSAATQVMATAASGWQNVRSLVLAAAQAVVNHGPDAVELSASNTTVDAMTQALTTFENGPLADVKSRFAAASQAFDTFYQSMTDAYRQCAGANTTASSALAAAHLALQVQQQQLQARISDLTSASGLALAFLTLGIYQAAELTAIRNQINSVEGQNVALSAQDTAYADSLATYMNALNATRQADYALDTLNTNMEQFGNAIGDIIVRSAGSLPVLSAYTSMLQTDYADAVTKANNLLAV